MSDLGPNAAPAHSLAGRRIVVTGGAGFIGSHLVERCLMAGAEHVTAIDDLFLGRAENVDAAMAAASACGIDAAARCTFHAEDASDTDRLATRCDEIDADLIFHLATIPLPTSLERPAFTVDVNTRLAIAVSEVARRRTDGGHPTRLVAFSSSEVYGTAERTPMDEEHPMRATTPYAASKAASDLVILSYARTFDVDAVLLRPFNNYGPRQNDRAYAGLLPIVVRRVQAGLPIEIHGDGLQTRDFLHARDTADAAIALALAEARGEVFNVCHGQETSVLELVETLLRLLGRPEHPVHHGPARAGDVRRHLGDPARAKDAFGYAPRVDLEDGLRETVAWYLQQPAPATDAAAAP